MKTVKKAGYAYLLAIVLTLYFAVMLPPVSELIPGIYDLAPSTMISEGTILVPALIFLLVTPARLNDVLGFHRIRIRTILWAVLLLVVLYPSVEFAGLFTEFFVDNAVNAAIGSSLGGLPVWEGLLIIGVAGPFVEEFIFRGYFYHTFRLTGRVAASVLLSGILFGLMHMNLNQACYAAILGFFLALAVEATGSTTTSFVMHMVFNSAETIMMYVADDLAEDSEASQITTEEALSMLGLNDFRVMILALAVLGVISIIGIVLAFLIIDRMALSENRRPLFFTKRTAQKSPGKGETTETTVSGTDTAVKTNAAGKHLMSCPLAVGMVLSAAYIVVFDFMM